MYTKLSFNRVLKELREYSQSVVPTSHLCFKRKDSPKNGPTRGESKLFTHIDVFRVLKEPLKELTASELAIKTVSMTKKLSVFQKRASIESIAL